MADAAKTNALVENTKAMIYRVYRELQERDNCVTAEKIKNVFLGIEVKQQTLLELFDSHDACGIFSISPDSYLKQAKFYGRFEQRIAKFAVSRRACDGAAFVYQRLKPVTVAGELREQVGRHRPCCLVLVDEVDKVVDAAKLVVDAAMPPFDTCKDAFCDVY
jgi:hypothetical protein